MPSSPPSDLSRAPSATSASISTNLSLQSSSTNGASPKPQPKPTSPSPSAASDSVTVEEQLERLTDAVHAVGHELHVCTAACEARCALCAARAEEERGRTLSLQEQLARMLALTRETVRRETEERVTSSPQKYVQDLQRAAFGAGRTPDSISRSSMMETD